MTVEPVAFQDCYSDANAHCYGCGRLNDRGLRIRTTWDPDDESASLTIFTPDDHLTGGVPGNLYGGILASLIDCHSTATASAVRAREDGQPLGEGGLPRFVTASLKVDFAAPTPVGVPLTLRGRVEEVSGRKVVVSTVLSADGKECVHGHAILVQMPPAS
ncbi:MAG: PaaI family thioesterase [Dehalococcoidia bacterium]|nr:PaaI family thioesterase [Dehalococcoidia bacterium]